MLTPTLKYFSKQEKKRKRKLYCCLEKTFARDAKSAL
jgi:hypothetical protein